MNTQFSASNGRAGFLKLVQGLPETVYTVQEIEGNRHWPSIRVLDKHDRDSFEGCRG